MWKGLTLREAGNISLISVKGNDGKNYRLLHIYLEARYIGQLCKNSLIWINPTNL